MQFDRLTRREFICLAGGGAVAWPLVARAQQPERMWRIGFRGPAPASSFAPRVEALRAGLRDLGYVEGKNILFEFRWADTVDQLPPLADFVPGPEVMEALDDGLRHPDDEVAAAEVPDDAES